MTTVVVGAGIVGTTIALALQARGREVLLIDRDAPGRGASFGNMASIAVTEFLPASRPAVWRRMPGWLIDAEGPIRIRPAYLPRLMPWFLRFLAASCPRRLAEIEAGMAALADRALEDTQALLRDAGLSDALSEEGCLALFADEAEFRDNADQIALLKRFAIPHEVLPRAGLRALEPEISPQIGLALHYPANRSIRDPFRLVTDLAAVFRARGGRVERGEVASFHRGGGIEALRLTDGRRIGAKEVVICAGAHSARLARDLGEPIPLETERGYHTQIMAPGMTLRHSLIWPARAFMVTPTAGGIRVGGTVEMAGLDAPPDYRRARVTVRKAQALLPDTLPVISASARTRGVFYATGHGHLGLTLAATTARLMAGLVTGAEPALDLSPYRIDRF
jgi:D-amino-acid dehydrogenase